MDSQVAKLDLFFLLWPKQSCYKRTLFAWFIRFEYFIQFPIADITNTFGHHGLRPNLYECPVDEQGQEEHHGRLGQTAQESRSNWNGRLQKVLDKVQCDSFIFCSSDSRRLFENHPDYINYFPFRDKPDWVELKEDKRMKAHALNVAYSLTMIIDSIDNREVFQEMVLKIAKSHVRRKLTVEHFTNLRTALVETMVTVLGEETMNAETIDSWAKAYKVILVTMQAEQERKKVAE